MIIYDPSAPRTLVMDGAVPDDAIDRTIADYVAMELDLCFPCIMDGNEGCFTNCRKLIVSRGHKHTIHCPILLRDLIQKTTGILI
jgi:hypothetical protein